MNNEDASIEFKELIAEYFVNKGIEEARRNTQEYKEQEHENSADNDQDNSHMTKERTEKKMQEFLNRGWSDNIDDVDNAIENFLVKQLFGRHSSREKWRKQVEQQQKLQKDLNSEWIDKMETEFNQCEMHQKRENRVDSYQ